MTNYKPNAYSAQSVNQRNAAEGDHVRESQDSTQQHRRDDAETYEAKNEMCFSTVLVARDIN